MSEHSSTDDAPAWLTAVADATGGARIGRWEQVQSLWSGYGQILRCWLQGHGRGSVIVKHVRWPTEQDHPRGWNSDRSHQRKVRSYEVEAAWYRDHAERCDDRCRVPTLLKLDRHGDDVLMVLEDLDGAGYPARRRAVDDGEFRGCLTWLANFHATFMGSEPRGLWPVGTYWHLETRPDELEAIADPALKQAAAAIDRRLREAPYQTFVHGDAKLANFCFTEDGSRVAAVDFQYVGGGCGMKDVAYFVGSCLDEDECEAREQELLDFYFARLSEALARAGSGRWAVGGGGLAPSLSGGLGRLLSLPGRLEPRTLEDPSLHSEARRRGCRGPMSLSPDDLLELRAVACDAAATAGAYIARSRPEHIDWKAGISSPASQIVTEVDRRAEELIVDHLAASMDELAIGLLTEERDDDSSRREKDYFWCIDPLDGTLPFVNGESGYAVSIALVSRSGKPVVGAIYIPAEERLYGAALGHGVISDKTTWAQPRPSPERLLVCADQSFEHREQLVAGLESRSYPAVDVQTIGGAVVHACHVLENPPACYLKLPKAEVGGGSIWDFAATACLFAEAGAVATDIHGTPLDLNRPDSTFMNHRGVLYATDDGLASAVRDWGAEHL